MAIFCNTMSSIFNIFGLLLQDLCETKIQYFPHPDQSTRDEYVTMLKTLPQYNHIQARSKQKTLTVLSCQQQLGMQPQLKQQIYHVPLGTRVTHGPPSKWTENEGQCHLNDNIKPPPSIKQRKSKNFWYGECFFQYPQHPFLTKEDLWIMWWHFEKWLFNCYFQWSPHC